MIRTIKNITQTEILSKANVFPLAWCYFKSYDGPCSMTVKTAALEADCWTLTQAHLTHVTLMLQFP